MVDHSEQWAYDESFLWGNNFPQCNNLKQSPINLDTDNLKECRTLCNITHRFASTKCFVQYKNKTITLRPSSGSFTEYESTLYELKEISIHTPSLHSIDGQKFDLEICLIHKLSDNSSQNAGLMVCCMFERGPHHGNSEQFISQIINDIPADPIDYDKEVNVSDLWSADMVIPEKSGYFSYDGSLPYPPCQEGYKVFVYEKIGNIGDSNIETFKKYLGNNARPTRPLGTRTIFYTPFLESRLSDKKVFRSNNKYLKCYRERVGKAIDSSTTSPSISNASLSSGMEQDTKSRIRGILLSIIIIVLLVNSVYFVKFLYRHFYIQKMLRMFAGKENIKNDIIRSWKNCQGTVITETQKELMKQAKNNAEAATNNSVMMSGMDPRSIQGFREMTGPMMQGIGSGMSSMGMPNMMGSQYGSQGYGSQGYGRQGYGSRGYGSSTYPSSGSRGYGSSSYPGRY